MNPDNTLDDISNLDDFANLNDIIMPKPKDENIPAEYLISDNFVVPGIITQYFDEYVLFKPCLSDEIFRVPYKQIRHPPKITIDCKYELGNEVEVYVLDPKLNLHGWARSTITSVVKATCVVLLQERNSLVVIQRDKVRAITTGAFFVGRYLHTFHIPVPKVLQNFASNIKVHETFCKAIGNPHISYDFEKNDLVISSSNADCESTADMLLSVHFTNLLQRMLLTESIDELVVRFQKMKTEDLLEQFQIHPDLLKYAIGQSGKNIRQAESIPGVTFITVIKETSTVKIYAQNTTAIQNACELLKLEKEIIEIPNEMISKVIGKNGQKVQEIVDDSRLRHIVINKSENPESDVIELELIGTSASINHAKSLIEFHLYHLQAIKTLVKNNRDVNQQYNNVFEDKNTKSSESPADGVLPSRLTRRVVSGRKYQNDKKLSTIANEKKLKPELIYTGNQDLIFYNETLSRGRAGLFSGGRSNTRSRGRFGYQTTQSRVDSSEDKSPIMQSTKQFQQSITNRGRSRGRGRARGLARAQKHDVNSVSRSRESLNINLLDENHEQAQKQPLVEAGDASTSRDEEELERQRKQGAIKRVPQNLPRRKDQQTVTSGTSNQAEIRLAPEYQKSWFGKRWRNRNTSSADIRTWEYENWNRVYYAKNNTKRSANTTGENAAPRDDREEI